MQRQFPIILRQFDQHLRPRPLQREREHGRISLLFLLVDVNAHPGIRRHGAAILTDDAQRKGTEAERGKLHAGIAFGIEDKRLLCTVALFLLQAGSQRSFKGKAIRFMDPQPKSDCHGCGSTLH